MPRSGSTLLYNIVRIVASHIDSNTLAGWIDDTLTHNQTIRQYISQDSKSFPVVYKTHEVSPILLNRTDIFFISHRDPMAAISSLLCMFPAKYISVKVACNEYAYFIHNIEQIFDLRVLTFEHNWLRKKVGTIDAIRKISRLLGQRVGQPVHVKFYKSIYKSLQQLKQPTSHEFGGFAHPASLLHYNHAGVSLSCVETRLSMLNAYDTKQCRETVKTYFNAFEKT